MNPWRILLTEEIHPDGRRLLAEQAEVVVASAVDEESLCREVAGVQAIVARARGRISARVIAAAPHLRVIGRHGVGVDNIDVAAATRLGIRVVNTPGANDQSVAEHAIALLLALAKRLPAADKAVRSGDWEFRNRGLAAELAGGALGVVGMGRIGRKVAAIARVIGMRIGYTDLAACPEAEESLGAVRLPLDELLRSSDAVSLHLPLLPETRHLLGARELALMHPLALLINTARGELVDTDALVAALNSGHLAGAALDVFEPEPLSPGHPLAACERALLTPHSAAMTEAAARRMALVAEDVLRVLNGVPPRHPVNLLQEGV